MTFRMDKGSKHSLMETSMPESSDMERSMAKATIPGPLVRLSMMDNGSMIKGRAGVGRCMLMALSMKDTGGAGKDMDGDATSPGPRMELLIRASGWLTRSMGRGGKPSLMVQPMREALMRDKDMGKVATSFLRMKRWPEQAIREAGTRAEGMAGGA